MENFNFLRSVGKGQFGANLIFVKHPKRSSQPFLGMQK